VARCHRCCNLGLFLLHQHQPDDACVVSLPSAREQHFGATIAIIKPAFLAALLLPWSLLSGTSKQPIGTDTAVSEKDIVVGDDGCGASYRKLCYCVCFVGLDTKSNVKVDGKRLPFAILIESVALRLTPMSNTGSMIAGTAFARVLEATDLGYIEACFCCKLCTKRVVHNYCNCGLPCCCSLELDVNVCCVFQGGIPLTLLLVLGSNYLFRGRVLQYRGLGTWWTANQLPKNKHYENNICVNARHSTYQPHCIEPLKHVLTSH
jgi:hypothetical protein